MFGEARVAQLAPGLCHIEEVSQWKVKILEVFSQTRTRPLFCYKYFTSPLLLTFTSVLSGGAFFHWSGRGRGRGRGRGPGPVFPHFPRRLYLHRAEYSTLNMVAECSSQVLMFCTSTVPWVPVRLSAVNTLSFVCFHTSVLHHTSMQK
jgi:hypothetical protein